MDKLKKIGVRLKNYFKSLRLSDSKKMFPILSSIFLLILVVFIFYKFSFGRSVYVAKYIAFQSEDVSRILKEVDDTCNILSIRGDRNSVDFLTVKEFVGSEIGCLNLAYPKNWHGPFLSDNPTVNGVLFDIVKASDGYYVLPGEGVNLPNGLIMGADIKIGPGTDMAHMLQAGGALEFKGFLFAKKLNFKIGDWDFLPKQKKKIEKLEKSFAEVAEALPYT